jgi:hypothetical protein
MKQVANVGYIPLKECNRYNFNKKRKIVTLGQGKLEPAKTSV